MIQRLGVVGYEGSYSLWINLCQNDNYMSLLLDLLQMRNWDEKNGITIKLMNKGVKDTRSEIPTSSIWLIP